MTRSLGNGKARAIWSASVLARSAATISRCGRGRSRSGHSLGAGNNSQYQAKEQVEYQAKNRRVFACYAGRTPRISWNFRVENRRENFSREKIRTCIDVSAEVPTQIAGD